MADVDHFLATRTVTPSSNGHVTADMSSSMTELVHLVDRLQRENRDLAGMVGSLQQRLVFADDRIRALRGAQRARIQGKASRTRF